MDEPYELRNISDQEATETKSNRLESVATKDNETLARLGKIPVLKVLPLRIQLLRLKQT